MASLTSIATAAPFRSLKRVDLNTLHLLNGYLKLIEEQLSINSCLTIPPLIHHLILKYYYLEETFFAFGTDIQLNKDRDIMTSKCITEHTAYGRILVSQSDIHTVYCWELKILSMNTKDETDAFIGIDCTNRQCINSDFLTPEALLASVFYAYSADGFIAQPKSTKSFGESFSEGDTIKMIINTQNKTLSFYKNDKFLGIAIDNIDFTDNKQYTLAVSMGYKNDSVQIVSFSAS